ncbi:MAG: DNA topoisomerase [Clostridia bacterium]|nr:DNA topoisomerase [Clostridia bacterium]MBQ3928168.1 DNA topoisomerase [Clostridia bacterium]MBQ7727727.1 DNA topoisomerase [Clostridia bacterium]
MPQTPFSKSIPDTVSSKPAKTVLQKKNGSQGYGDDSIVALKGADRVRLRPAVIFGSDGLEGCEHSFFEILSNAVDEAREGHGKEIVVTVFTDRSIEVDDHGRGVPLGWNSREERWNWDLIYCELYAGGKYKNNEADANYGYSLGTNGLGACATQYSSEWMEVRSYDGLHESSISFKGGAPASELSVRDLEPREKRTGTIVRWRPDLEVFTDIDIPYTFFIDIMHRQAVVNAGVRFTLKLQQPDGKFQTQFFEYANGISDYLAEIVGEDAMTEPVLWHLETQGRDRPDMPDYKLKADFAFCTSKSVNRQEFYHNSSFLEHGGSPAIAVKAAFTYAVDKFLKNTGRYKANEAKVTFTDISDALIIVINSFSTMTSYENQTKKSITNKFIAEAMTSFLKDQLDIYFTEHPVDADLIANQILINKRSREKAESVRIEFPKSLSQQMDLSNRVEKFVSCRSKDPNLRELYIVEGDSALTSCKLGRAAEFQAIIPVRGKTLNCMKVGYDRIFKSDIITDLLRVIGCGAEVKGKVKGDINTFDYKALKWSKIIICTDADEDGFQIRTLLLTLFYRLLPTLLEKGKVFIAESPLFEITTKDKTYFAYDEFEKAEILKKLGKTKYTLQRSKGLGENEPEMMWQTTMNPATRRLVAVTPTDAAATEVIFDTLLGENLNARKRFIAEKGHLYVKDADI